MTPTAPGTPLPPSDAEYQAEAERVLQRMLDHVPRADLDEPLVVHGPPGPSLVEIGQNAELIVVGSRGRGAIAAGLLGSVGLHCVNHASVPVAIVPADAAMNGRFRHAIVGVDGSDHSVDALAWVLRHASDETVVEAVSAWSSASTTVASVPSLAEEELADQAGDLAAEVVEKARVRAGGSDLPVSVVAVRGDPREVLRERASAADLLVVGARGRSGIAHLLVGSVATALVHDPPVTTVVVR